MPDRSGAAYTRKALKDVYEAEEGALKETLSQCSPSFISDLTLFTENLKSAFEKIENQNEEN